MTDLELQRLERAVRKAVTSIIEHEVPIALAVRAAAVSLLQGDPDPAAALPHERPERCARQNREGLFQMAELEADGRGRDAAMIVARRQVADPRDPDSVYRRAIASGLARTGGARPPLGKSVHYGFVCAKAGICVTENSNPVTTDTFFCSQLVVLAFASADVPLINLAAADVTPADIVDVSVNLIYIGRRWCTWPGGG